MKQIQETETKGFIPTLNRMGYMTSTLDPVSLSFIKFAAELDFQVLEIGAAYGVATIPDLQKGAKMIANDLDERHLQVLKKNIPEECKPRLQTMTARFPNEIYLEPESV